MDENGAREGRESGPGAPWAGCADRITATVAGGLLLAVVLGLEQALADHVHITVH